MMTLEELRTAADKNATLIEDTLRKLKGLRDRRGTLEGVVDLCERGGPDFSETLRRARAAQRRLDAISFEVRDYLALFREVQAGLEAKISEEVG